MNVLRIRSTEEFVVADRMSDPMRVTLYLPDETGRLAKQARLNLSGLLRTAVERELRGEAAEDARRIAGADVSTRAVPGGLELVVFIPAGEQPTV
jgi:post-segregation antitoxin (ccd killing protein)